MEAPFLLRSFIVTLGAPGLMESFLLGARVSRECAAVPVPPDSPAQGGLPLHPDLSGPGRSASAGLFLPLRLITFCPVDSKIPPWLSSFSVWAYSLVDLLWLQGILCLSTPQMLKNPTRHDSCPGHSAVADLQRLWSA